MDAAPMRGIVLEGVTGSGKTTLFGALQEQLRPAATKLILSEHYTDRLLEEERKHDRLTVAEAIRHTETVLQPVRTFGRLEAAGKFAGRGGDAGVYVLVERFLGSHLAYLARSGIRPTDDEGARISVLYEELAALGIRVVVLRLSAATLPRAVLSTRPHRSSAWRAWLASHGDDDAIAAAFGAWQEALLGAYEGLAAEIVDVAAPWDRDAAQALARRLAATFL